MSTTGIYRRIRRRETHASRATPAIIVAVIALLALAWLTTETVIAAVSGTALLLSPTDMVQNIAALPTVAPALLITAAVVLAIVGLVLLIIALSSGRLGRHTIDDDRAVVVVHDQVIGSALVRAAADNAAIDPDRAVAAVGKRRATVRITPTSGTDLDRTAITTAVTDAGDSFRLTPAIKSRIIVNKKGKVGA